ncbi:MAG: restriction endonuclease subunit M [Candidatus Viridilinea halotolerans]|uniref:Restriction endonuclease subunit M n=1 Tax=Candidatus Viridilinea halotolerans TaxID=2491704 RepID=A0A426TSJ7_9CHLR|nr:MAG: restriction endonuclease subunit M [Candidatus Viridilinea halotolerans]
MMPKGFIMDRISGEKRKDTPKEAVRQRIAWALLREDGISFDDMASDFPVTIDGRRRKIDIAIFHEGKPHTEQNISRVVVCRPEPAIGRTVVRIRDHQQADKDLVELKEIMTGIDGCRYGLWTNGLDFFFLEKRATRFEVDFDPISYWPTAGDSQGTPETASRAVMRRADEAMLRTAFRRCHNFIHGNEGMPKDAAFWQFLYLIFCKIHDERSPRDARQFWIGAKEQFEPQGQKAVRRRILTLFEEVKQRYQSVFRGNEEITLSDRALAFMVSELSRYDLLRTDVDVKGAAYQEIVGTNLRGDRGQYFTPRGVTKLAVEMLAPKETERVLDPACGTGGFLTATLAYMLHKFRDEQKSNDTTEEFNEVTQRLSDYAQKYVFGADFDPFLIKASQMHMVMSGDGRGHLYNINSLEFPEGHLGDVRRAVQECNLGTMDIVITNPPFGSDIPIDDPVILRQYELAQRWERLDDGTFRSTGDYHGRVAPEVLFIERCVRWLKRDGGRMGIVLPNGILGNPAAEYIRAWILRNTWVLASIDLPVEVFIVDANVNILTSLLFLKRKTDEEIMAEARGGQVEYPIFMAVAEKVGFDRRGNPLYKRNPDGTDIVTVNTVTERMVRKGKEIVHTFTRPEREVDNDLPIIAREYRAFLEREARNYAHLRGL